jgi:murein DD-endopeptidase MepM/ murein hydrolase activator NlpD
MAWPLKKTRKVTCPYGKKGTQWKSGWHQGVDIGAPVGDPVYAAADGEVIGVGIWGSSFGKFSPVIKHGKWYTIYAHVGKCHVKKGDKVKLGQHIADIGLEGLSSGPHLHFEIQDKGIWTPGGSKDPKWLLAYKGTNPLKRAVASVVAKRK